MNDTVKAITEYKAQACAMVNGHCEKCEACYVVPHREHTETYYAVSDKLYCCFDTVNRFIEQAQKPIEERRNKL